MVMQELKIEPLYQVTPQGFELKFIPVFDDIPPQRPADIWSRDVNLDLEKIKEEIPKDPH